MGHDAVIDVSVETLKDIARLETSWKELEARATHSFYLSWLWIGALATPFPGGRATTRSRRSVVGRRLRLDNSASNMKSL
jgi:hypothetical protein